MSEVQVWLFLVQCPHEEALVNSWAGAVTVVVFAVIVGLVTWFGWQMVNLFPPRPHRERGADSPVDVDRDTGSKRRRP